MGPGFSYLGIGVAGNLLAVEPDGEGGALSLHAKPVPVALLEQLTGSLRLRLFRIAAHVERAGHVAFQAPRHADLHLHLGLPHHDAAVDLPLKPHLTLEDHITVGLVGVEHRALLLFVIQARQHPIGHRPILRFFGGPAGEVFSVEHGRQLSRGRHVGQGMTAPENHSGHNTQQKEKPHHVSRSQ